MLGGTQTRAPGGVSGMTPFEGGMYQASGVVALRGAGAALFVDNGRPGQVFVMRLGADGKQAGPVKAVALGVDVDDLEGVTTDGTYFYAVSSQSRPKLADKGGLVRFKLDVAGERASDVSVIVGLKDFLLKRVPELRQSGKPTGREGGLNIEGLAWDPRRGRLLLGLRSPLAGDQALLVPLRLRDARGAFAADNLEVEGGKAIRLPLGGGGVRGFEYDARAGAFRIISGAPDNLPQTVFRLWEWGGDDRVRASAPRETRTFDPELKPEGVARVGAAGGRESLMVVFDAGGYTLLD